MFDAMTMKRFVEILSQSFGNYVLPSVPLANLLTILYPKVVVTDLKDVFLWFLCNLSYHNVSVSGEH